MVLALGHNKTVVWLQPLYCVRAVNQIEPESVTALQYFSNSLSLSLALTAISAKNGEISSPVQRGRARNKSAKRAAGSGGSSEAGK